MWFGVIFVPLWPLLSCSVALAITIAIILRHNWRFYFEESPMVMLPRPMPRKPARPGVYRFVAPRNEGRAYLYLAFGTGVAVLLGFLALCFAPNIHSQGIVVPSVTVSDLMGRMATSPYDRADTGYIVDGKPVDVVLDRKAQTITITVLPPIGHLNMTEIK